MLRQKAHDAIYCSEVRNKTPLYANYELTYPVFPGWPPLGTGVASVQILVRARDSSRTSHEGQKRPVFASVSTRIRKFRFCVARGEQNVPGVRVWFIGAARCTGTVMMMFITICVIVFKRVSMPGFMVHAQWFMHEVMHFMHTLHQTSAGRTKPACQLRSCTGSYTSCVHTG